MTVQPGANKATPKGEGFFHIDRRVWKMLCGRNEMKQAVVYLTVAAGTGRGNKISRWSAQAVETYTGMHSSRATRAIAELVRAGYLGRTEASSRTSPVYAVESFDHVHELAHAAARAEDSYAYAEAMQAVQDGTSVHETRTAKRVAPVLLSGLVWKQDGKYTLKPEARGEVPELIWLPNTLVTGTSALEPSPLKRYRGGAWTVRFQSVQREADDW